MIYRQEQILHSGREFKFKTAPMDPYDAFRGRYVALQFDLGSHEAIHSNGKIWVRFDEDSQGFAKIKEESLTPLSGNDVLVATTRYNHLQLPFDRYYMDEKSAPEAETAYRQNSRRNVKNAYVTVRLLNGHTALDELFIDGKPIHDYLKGTLKN